MSWITRLFSRMRRRLDELDVDDTALEDEQEPLYEHGNKMDSGPFATGLSGGADGGAC